MRKCKIILNILLVFTIIISMFPTTFVNAETDEYYTFSVVSQYEDANLVIPSMAFNDNTTPNQSPPWKWELPKSEDNVNVYTYEPMSNLSYDKNKFNFLGWKISCGNDTIDPTLNIDEQSINNKLTNFKSSNGSSYINEEEGFCLVGTTTADIVVEAVFEKIYNPSDAVYTASFKVNEINAGKVECLYGGNSAGKDKWTLTAIPADSMQFDYWTWVPFQNNTTTGGAVHSSNPAHGNEKLYENPLSVALDEITGNRTYTAHFEPVDLKLEQQDGGFDTNLDEDIVIGGREQIKIPYFLSNRILGSVKIEYEVYQGDGIQGKQLAKGIETIDGNAGSQFFSATVDPLHSSIKDEQFITVKARLIDNNEQRPWHTQSYDISSAKYIVPEMNNSFHYLSTTNEADETGGFTDAGPEIKNVYAYINDITGKLHLFLSSKKGVYSWDATGAEDLALMDMDADLKERMYYTNIDGGIYAVNGSHLDGLFGMVLTKERDENYNYYSYLSEYDFTKNQWKLIPETKFINMHNGYGVYPNLILSSNDIWSDNEYWNGTVWTDKGIKFTSFYKMNNQLGFGAANDGLYEITSGGTSKIMPELEGKDCFIQSASPSGKLLIKAVLNYKPQYYLVDTIAKSCTEIPSGVGEYSSIETMGFGCDDTLYKTQAGRGYLGASNYCETDIYRFDASNKQWILLEIPEFMDEKDDRTVLDTKIRPCHISSIQHPIPEVSIFTSPRWGFGSIYAQYNQTEHTITLDSQGGTCSTTSITGKLGDKVVIPLPSKANSIFEGWYYASSCVGEQFTTSDTIPAKDITLYAKWSNADGDKYATDREKAKKSLEEALAKCDQSEYTEENWNKLIKAYEKGMYDITIAKPTDNSAKEIYAALNNAILALCDIPTITVKKAEVCVSMDANTLGLGYLIKPTIVTIDKNTKASKVLTDLLYENGYTWEITGKIEDSFYLAQVKPADQTNVVVADYILKQPGVDIEYGDRDDDMLGEFDYYHMSGWMYSIGDNKNNKYPSFPGVGAASWHMTDGEVMRWQFTVYGYGADLNADNSEWGTTSIVPNLGNKNKLTWKVGELRRKHTDKELDANPVYQEAIKVLTNPEADQKAIDDSLSGLIDAFEENSGDSSGSGSGSSGGGGGRNASTVTTDKKVDPAASKITKDIKANVDSNGKVVVSVDAKGLSASLNKVVEAIKDSKKNIKPEVKINIKADNNKATSVEMSMNKSSLTEMSKNEAQLTVNTPLATIAFDEKSIKAIESKVKDSDIKLSAEKIGAANVIKDLEASNTISDTTKAEIMKVVGNRNVLDLSIISGKENVTSFGKGTVKVSLPYTLAAGEDASNLGIVYINEKGDMVKIASSYSTKNHTIDFETGHFSYYAITYDDKSIETGAKAQFNDVKASDWYSTSVMSLVGKGIIKGKTSNTFEPNSSITRAEFTQILYGMAKSQAGANGSAITVESVNADGSGAAKSFSDVKNTDWYAKAVEWASVNGIVKGMQNADGSINFMPNAKITRQDMAVMIQNYIQKVEKKMIEEKNQSISFADNSMIATYAKDAVSMMQKGGIISGIKQVDGAYKFAPKANATRAEAATMISKVLKISEK